jgi:hypothetical protein
LTDANITIEPEDRRKHLDFIQATITRMSAASTTSKSWMFPIVTVAYGYAVTQNASSVAVLGIGAALLFAYLDANYLRQEKRFRRLYMAVAEGKNEIAAFSLNPDDVAPAQNNKSAEDWASWMPRWINRFLPGPDVWLSWSVGPFYAPVIIAGIVLAATQ